MSELNNAIRYMETQIAKLKRSLDKSIRRNGVTESEINNIKCKIGYYETAVTALKKQQEWN